MSESPLHAGLRSDINVQYCGIDKEDIIKNMMVKIISVIVTLLAEKCITSYNQFLLANRLLH